MPTVKSVYILLIAVCGISTTGILGYRWFWHDPFAQQFGSEALFVTYDDVLRTKTRDKVLQMIGWKTLLPTEEAKLVAQHQSASSQSIDKQVFNQISASFNPDYQAMLRSTNTVSQLHKTLVSISGYIVPLTLTESKTVTTFFLVPYYGACIHFPPPAPNQMIYVRVPEGLALSQPDNAYTVTGLLQTAMYEDPVGTAAYVLDLVAVAPFAGEPDDVRNHQIITF